ncbi:hypothetical protein T8K17_11175 [Thalassobaculum sp. OXR-137]|uniref:hypothetical protein n=1 Tax=Thalassobaculum sp. OXR-137 TaxID=3100173 RepID=UPI002AC8C1D0|nr:hypothetical protein [Thalassobaculum sp. OXR-137]WPZ36696.1 hypothetical protein T8K17_11175 [Thalassobaculum sp. OXR-137]
MKRLIDRAQRTMPLIGLALILTGCFGTATSGDAGCLTWRSYVLWPSRQDTPATAVGLNDLNDAMGAACGQR